MLDHPPSISMKPSEFLSILWLRHQGKGIQNIWTLPDSKTYNFEYSTEIGSIDDTVESLYEKARTLCFRSACNRKNGGHINEARKRQPLQSLASGTMPISPARAISKPPCWKTWPRR